MVLLAVISRFKLCFFGSSLSSLSFHPFVVILLRHKSEDCLR